MIALASTKRQQRRLRDVRRTGARHKTLQSVTSDDSSCREMRPRLRADVAATEPLGRVDSHEPTADRVVCSADAWSGATPDRPLGELCSGNAGEQDHVRQAQPSLTFADVIRTFDAEYRRRHGPTLPVQQDRVLREIAACYTPLMGTHEWTCDDCGTVVELPNGCSNRHCPTCGDARRRKWAETTASQILPVQYYHVILTVPREITQLAMADPVVLYPIMLRSGAEAIKRCGRKLFQAELALLALLHSWGSLVNDHLHSHNMLPAGGLWVKALEWIALCREQIEELLVEVSTVFPERFIKALRKAHEQGQLTFEGTGELETLESPQGFERWLQTFNTTRWIIRCPQVWDRRSLEQDPDATIKTVKYLANYANRVALSNDRVVGIEGDQVLLRYKDYRDGDQWKTKPIDGVEFIERFLRHLLPPGMHHIRRYGWMGRRTANEKLAWLREYFRGKDSKVQQPQAAETEEDEQHESDEQPSRTCRYCQGTLHLTNTTYRPKVSEILVMPLQRFREARAGPIVTLSQKAKDAAKSSQEKNAETGREQRSCPISAHL